MDVRDADRPADLEEVRRLFRAFVAWHQERQRERLGLVAAYFDDAAWEAELAGLPGAYAAQEGGALLLAWDGGRALGCVALRDRGDDTCEMKRMYVDDAARRRGVGRVLGEAVVERARDLGYDSVLLDTSVDQHEAIGLYRSLGFEEVPAYYDVAEELRGWLVFFRLAL